MLVFFRFFHRQCFNLLSILIMSHDKAEKYFQFLCSKTNKLSHHDWVWTLWLLHVHKHMGYISTQTLRNSKQSAHRMFWRVNHWYSMSPLPGSLKSIRRTEISAWNKISSKRVKGIWHDKWCRSDDVGARYSEWSRLWRKYHIIITYYITPIYPPMYPPSIVTRWQA